MKRCRTPEIGDGVMVAEVALLRRGWREWFGATAWLAGWPGLEPIGCSYLLVVLRLRHRESIRERPSFCARVNRAGDWFSSNYLEHSEVQQYGEVCMPLVGSNSI